MTPGGRHDIRPGDRIHLAPDLSRLVVFDCATERRI
jgi:hypothetical protein